jgi:glycopeptide antibiotics resistance protein
MTRMTRAALIGVLVVYVAGLLVLTLWPSAASTPGAATAHEAISAAQDDGAPTAFGWASLERVANLLVFVPLGALIALLVPARLWAVGAVAGAGLSVVIEATQFFFLPDRDASWRDLAINSIGAAVGAVLVVLGRLLRARSAQDSNGHSTSAEGETSAAP